MLIAAGSYGDSNYFYTGKAAVTTYCKPAFPDLCTHKQSNKYPNPENILYPISKARVRIRPVKLPCCNETYSTTLKCNNYPV
jgi:hypothetical protein